MNAPDKIYLNKHMIRPGMLYPAQYPADTPEFEYIRKDALLEWAKENNKMIDTEDGDYSLGYVSAMIDLIDKIESL